MLHGQAPPGWIAPWSFAPGIRSLGQVLHQWQDQRRLSFVFGPPSIQATT